MPLTVNGEEITDAELRSEEAHLRPQLRRAYPRESQEAVEARIVLWARDNAIERVLLRQEAMADPEPLADGALEAASQRNQSLSPEQLEAQLRIERLTSRLTAKLAPPRPKEISEYYRRHPAEFLSPPMVRAAHILKKLDEQADPEAVLQQMQAIQAELEQGADFAEVAARVSDDSMSDLGFFGRGQMVPEFESVAFALRPGQSSGIIRTQFGYHILTVIAHRPAGRRTFDEVKDAIAHHLFDQKKRRRIEQHLDTLRAKADIQDSGPRP
ncbi:MAG: peptidylprolyl isomerase [Candidatus Solibacter sp.]